MTELPPLWIYKCNARSESAGDWLEFFLHTQPTIWGGSRHTRSRSSLKIVWERMSEGDLVLCWQSDKKLAVGLAEVAELIDYKDVSGEPARDILLRALGEPFSPGIPLLALRKHDKELAAVHAFTQGFAGTLYHTSSHEAASIFRHLRVTKLMLAKLRNQDGKSTPTGGAGFGTPEINKLVEEAAERILQDEYRDWDIENLTRQNVGYDFCVTQGDREKHVELKGVSGPDPAVIITENELCRAESDPLWCLAVVTCALEDSAALTEWTAAEFLAGFDMRPISHFARLRRPR